MAARSAVHATVAALVIRLVEVERSVGALDQSLHPRFGARNVLRGSTQILDALLEQLERTRQIELFAVASMSGTVANHRSSDTNAASLNDQSKAAGTKHSATSTATRHHGLSSAIGSVFIRWSLEPLPTEY